MLHILHFFLILFTVRLGSEIWMLHAAWPIRWTELEDNKKKTEVKKNEHKQNQVQYSCDEIPKSVGCCYFISDHRMIVQVYSRSDGRQLYCTPDSSDWFSVNMLATKAVHDKNY